MTATRQIVAPKYSKEYIAIRLAVVSTRLFPTVFIGCSFGLFGKNLTRFPVVSQPHSKTAWSVTRDTPGLQNRITLPVYGAGKRSSWAGSRTLSRSKKVKTLPLSHRNPASFNPRMALPRCIHARFTL
ncbi:hypothetical protein [Aliiroseovarius sediminilitoris]|uniref:hypothetical protein n=1 Tax=Aliiroseovarius sediminilitoris TaxID=1173584 RepID=UPI00115FB996|nr:hypothetical protein [Aliiroseovarius sediminilitoris]